MNTRTQRAQILNIDDALPARVRRVAVRYQLAAPLLLIAAVALLNIFTLLGTPAPFVDEAWNADRSYTLLHTGRAFGSLDYGVFNRYDGYWTYFPWLGAAVHAVSIFLLGPTLFAMRMVSIAFGVVLLASIYATANHLFGRRAGLLALALVSVSGSFVYSSHLARHDIVVAALCFTAVALYVCDDRKGFPWQSLLAGLVVGLTPDIHLNGIIFIPTIALLYLNEYRLAVLRSKRFWMYVLGIFVAMLYFALVHIVRYPETYTTLFSLGNGAGRTPPLFSSPDVVLAAIKGTLDLLGPVQVTLAAISLAFLAWRRTASDRLLILLFGALFIFFSLVIRWKPPFYIILLAPAVGLLGGVALDGLLQLNWRRTRLVFMSTALACALSFAMLISALTTLFGEDASQDYNITLAGVRQAVQPGTKLMGSQTWWFAVPDQTYYSWDQLVYYQRYGKGTTVEDVFRNMKPDYFVLDSWMLNWFVTDDPAKLAQAGDSLFLSKSDLMSFLDRQAHLESTIRTTSFGEVRIYKIDWSKTGADRSPAASNSSGILTVQQAYARRLQEISRK